jgi:hypothetical protein
MPSLKRGVDGRSIVAKESIEIPSPMEGRERSGGSECKFLLPGLTQDPSELG